MFSADEEWPGLVNALSGLLCAHLNVIGPTSTYQPQYSFRPVGPVIGEDFSRSTVTSLLYTITQRTKLVVMALLLKWCYAVERYEFDK